MRNALIGRSARAVVRHGRFIAVACIAAVAGYASADVKSTQPTAQLRKVSEVVTSAPLTEKGTSLCSGGGEANLEMKLSPRATFKDAKGVGATYKLELQGRFAGKTRATFSYAVFDDRGNVAVPTVDAPVVSLGTPPPQAAVTETDPQGNLRAAPAPLTGYSDVTPVVASGLKDGYYELRVKAAAGEEARLKETSETMVQSAFFHVAAGEIELLEPTQYYERSNANAAVIQPATGSINNGAKR